MERITERQLEVLRLIHRATEERGFPPTIEEIRREMGFASTNAVYSHLKALVFKGYLTRTAATSRSFVLTRLARHTLGLKPSTAAGEAHSVAIPLMGKVAAGVPLLAVEQSGDSLQFDSFLLGGGGRPVFALRVRGDSMIGDGIHDGDYLFVRKTPKVESGQIVVALIDEEATCKRYYPEGDLIRFQPANPKLVPLLIRKADFRSTMILGVVVGVYRQLKTAWERRDDPPPTEEESRPAPTSAGPSKST
jgi:repressor LexA